MAGMTGFVGTPAGTAVTSPSASRDFFMKRHALTSSEEEKEQIEMIAGPDFTFDVLSDDEMSSVADGMKGPQPTLDEAADASIDQMADAQAQADAREIEQANDQKLRREREEEQRALLAERDVGQMAPKVHMNEAYGGGMSKIGTQIGTEFSRRA